MFTHLHVQSGYSLLKSTVKIEDLVAKAKAEKMDAIALCDRNVMYGALYFYKQCKKNGIKPIIGMLADILYEEDSFPILLFARNNKGYQNLLKISSAIQTKSPKGLPLKWLKAYSAGLIAISPGEGGKVETLLLEEQEELALKEAETLIQIFGVENTYFSIQRLAVPEEERRNEKIEQLAKRAGIKVVATNPIFYLHKKDALAHEVLLSIGNGDKLSDETREVMPSKEFYFKSSEEMRELFSDAEHAVANTNAIAAICNVQIPFNQTLLPKYPIDSTITSDELLADICLKGLKERGLEAAAYIERLQYELRVIKKMQFSDYFLIVWDFMEYARSRGILTGPGRGSAAGSMVAYALKITNVDPIKHSLLFERFLNPERITMPDIDIDFPDHRREEVIEYVAKKYGEYHVAQIITFGTMAAKAALRDTGRVFGLNTKEQEALSKMIPNKLGITLTEAYQQSPKLQKFVQENETNQKLFGTALILEGLPRHTSTHAAGVIISDIPLTDIIAIQSGHEGVHLTQFPMDLLEELGLLKMDFLGLRNLTLIENILVNIEKGTGKKIDLSVISMNDSKVFDLFTRGDTTGIFQFESEGIRKVLTRLKPNSFEDIVAVNALYRPGPMENIPLFIERKHGITPITYEHPDLEDILKPTYGIIVYQEQIIQIAAKLAGFSLGEADLLRRAVSKKNKEVLEEQRKYFINGAKKKDYSDKIADSIYNLIVRFANYGFNRSHAVAYSVIAYQLAYLKTHYPTYFMAALMTSVIGNEDKISGYIREAKKMGISVTLPSINESIYPFTVRDGQIQYSLGAIKGIGGAVLKEIFAARRKKRFHDLFDFCLRVSGKIVNHKVLEALIYSGAFDEFGYDRATLLASIDVALEHADLVSPEGDLFDLIDEGEFVLKGKYVEVEPIRLEDKLSFEKKVLGLYLSNHPLGSYRKLFASFGCVTIEEAINSEDTKAIIGVYISAVKTIRTKKGEVMAFLSLGDEDGDIEGVMFPNVYRSFADKVQTGAIALVNGTIEERDGKKQVSIQQVFALDEVKELANSSTSTLFIKIESHKHTKDVLLRIRKILLQYTGQTKVIVYYEREHRYIQLPFTDWVTPNEHVLKELSKIVGNGNIILKKD